jgi:hypothetical protein
MMADDILKRAVRITAIAAMGSAIMFAQYRRSSLSALEESTRAGERARRYNYMTGI